jgi:hypothetical protein
MDAFRAGLPHGLASSAIIAGEAWLRCVCANPNADMDQIIETLDALARRPGP